MTYQRLTAPVQLDAISALLDALETCHVCGGTLHLEDVEPTHCEDCSSYCEDHEEPACAPMYLLVRNARAENTALRAELRHWLEEIAGTPPEALWQMQDDRLRYVEIQIAKKDYEAARKRLEELNA